jgi:hypothetical protein
MRISSDSLISHGPGTGAGYGERTIAKRWSRSLIVLGHRFATRVRAIGLILREAFHRALMPGARFSKPGHGD